MFFTRCWSRSCTHSSYRPWHARASTRLPLLFFFLSSLIYWFNLLAREIVSELLLAVWQRRNKYEKLTRNVRILFCFLSLFSVLCTCRLADDYQYYYYCCCCYHHHFRFIPSNRIESHYCQVVARRAHIKSKRFYFTQGSISRRVRGCVVIKWIWTWARICGARGPSAAHITAS